jgi:hypothetical protein
LGKIDEQISYNWLFFLLAGAFGAVTFWAVYDETATRREYKSYQETFFKIETDLADKALKAAKAKLASDAEYQKLVAEKKQLETDLAGPKKQAFEDAKAKLQEAEFEAFDKQQNYTFTKSLMDETYYYFTKAKHERTAELPEREKKLKAYQDQLAKDEVVMSGAAKARDEQKAKVNAFTSRLDELGKLIEKAEAEEKDAERKYAASVEKQGGMFGPATEIIQQNIEDIGKVDRCESCHGGSNRGGFETVQPKYYHTRPCSRSTISRTPIGEPCSRSTPSRNSAAPRATTGKGGPPPSSTRTRPPTIRTTRRSTSGRSRSCAGR